MKNTPISKSHGTSSFLIATACLLLLLSFGYRAGFGLFVKPITEANGWGREIISIKMPMRYLLVIIYSARAVVITLFLWVPFSLVSVLVFSATMGFLWLATVPPTSGLVAVMFGTRYMAMLYGIVFFGHQVGSFIGVWLGGWLYDRSGSYDPVWWLGAALGVMAAILHWLMRERPVKRLAAENL